MRTWSRHYFGVWTAALAAALAVGSNSAQAQKRPADVIPGNPPTPSFQIPVNLLPPDWQGIPIPQGNLGDLGYTLTQDLLKALQDAGYEIRYELNKLNQNPNLMPSVRAAAAFLC
jgi:hypothetical protein